MCNIAGYAGGRPAAPILLEILRRQEPFDGNMSTGVATSHEGKLHYRKMVGSGADLIKNTDVLDLPGTIGIAHSRPGGMANIIKPGEDIPATELVSGQLALDENGYVLAGESTATSIPGVFAVGDVRTKQLRQIITAAADGAVAAHMAEEYLRTL